MNIMKKKPELLKKTGKSSQTLRKFLNNLKENDLHYENKQITQCVFLGVLRLKPVPSIFSNNVPSVSTVESNKSKRIKNININKELNKNASKKNNINKVLSGKVSKKNPEKVKAAVKKVPIKKPNIKIKLNTKSKIHEAEPSTSNGKQTSLPSTSNGKQTSLPSTASKTVSPDSIIARSTLTLNPITSPTKFNPVQNLFDKLKQRREINQNEAGPSKITSPSTNTKETSKSTSVKYKVCKINANGRDSPNSNSCKKLKKALHKKSHERLTLPLTSSSPITVSDTESTGKKDSDIILLDENNSNNSDSSDNGIVEDIIVINDDPKPKSTSKENVLNQEIIDKSIQIRQASPLRKTNSKQLEDTSQCQEVIVITDEPKQTGKLEGNNNISTEKDEDHMTNKNDVIIIEEVREVRVSPRLKKMEEKAKEVATNIGEINADEVIIVTDENKVSNTVHEILHPDPITTSKVQDPNIAIDDCQNGNKKTPPKLKTVDSNKEVSVNVKKELIEETLIVSDKPKKRKNRLRSPTLLPPMLLNAPMLLRSELAPKKPNYVVEKPRVRKPRNKTKDTTNSKSIMPVVEQVKGNDRDGPTKPINKNLETLQLKKISSSDPGTVQLSASTTSGCSSQSNRLISDEIICLDDTTKNKSTNDKAVAKKLHVTHHKSVTNVEIEKVQQNSCPQQLTQKENSKSPGSKQEENVTNDIIVVNDDETPVKPELKTKPEETRKQKIKIFQRKSEAEVNAHKDEEVIIVKEESDPKENISPRLLRSDRLKQRQEETNTNVPVADKTESEVNNFINLTEEPELNKHVSPRTLRSNVIKEGPPSKEPMENTILIKDEEISMKNEEQPKLNRSEKKIKKLIQRAKLELNMDLDEIIIVSDKKGKKQKEKSSDRLLRSELSQLTAKEKIPVKKELEEVVVLIHEEPKEKEKSPMVTIKSKSSQVSVEQTGKVNAVEDPKNQVEVQTPRSLRADRTRKINSEVTSPKLRPSRIMKKETNSLPSPSIHQQLEVDDLQIISPNDHEQPLKDASRIKVERQNSSPRLLRSERAQKEVQENTTVSNGSIDKIISAPRLLRSDMSSQKNSAKDQYLSPTTTRTRKSSQRSPQSKMNTPLQDGSSKVVVIQNELLEGSHFNKIASDDLNSKQNTEIQKPSESPVSKKSPKRIGQHSKILTSSRKVIVSKKKKKFRKRNAVAKTSMLLRSELARLKNVTSGIKQNEKRATLRRAKSKVNDVPIKMESIENSNSDLEHNKQKNKNTKISQTKDSRKNVPILIDSKENSIKSTIPIVVDKNSEVVATSNDEVSEKSADRKEIATEIICTEVVSKCEENNSKNSLTGKTKKSDVLCGDVVQSSTGINLVTTETVSSNTKSPSRRKKSRKKRKLKLLKEELQPSEENCQEIQEEYETHTISKKTDITVFDFDESEPEVVPLRVNSTPKKEKAPVRTSKELTKSTPLEENVTPKSKKQKVSDEPITKVQAKVQLLPMFEESSTQENNVDTNTEKNKSKATPKKKTGKNQDTQESLSIPQNENVKKKRSRSKTSDTSRSKQAEDIPNKPDTPRPKQSEEVSKKTRTSNSPSKQTSITLNKPDASQSKQSEDASKKTRTSTSPLKQTTITDMFNVMMKKEKSSADSVFESTPKDPPAKPQEKTSNENAKTNMPPPKLDRKPLPNNEEDDEECYEDDSDGESRMEWIPEEYAEYKFKYSAKKMMTYKPIHKCKICLLILPTYYKLSKHKEEHAKKQNPYNCKQCEQSFSNVEDLTAHLRVHKGKHPYTCKKCDVGFWSKKSLDAHTPIHVLRKVKQPNKRFRCDVCAKEFSKLCDMERHTRVHTGEKPCICNICNKRFQQSHNLSKHLLTHLHVKPFHCEICNKQFGRNDVLNRHLLTHSVEKPIKCPLCSKGFIRQSQLNNHMKKNHPDSAKIGANAEKVAEAK